MNYQFDIDDAGNAKTDSILKIDDKGAIASVPNDPKNTDWQAYLKWAKSNTPLPADPTAVKTAQDAQTAVSTSKSLLTQAEADIDAFIAIAKAGNPALVDYKKAVLALIIVHRGK